MGFQSESCMVIILGMHRSGTSSLAGCLQQRGLYLGKVIEESPYNPKGNRENPAIMRLNESVLSHSGGSWNRPPQVISWTRDQVTERNRIIESYVRHSPSFGFKDPRNLFTLPFWEDSRLYIRYVGTFRNPLSAAKSLHARDGIPIPDGLALWKQYNSRLMSLHSIHRFPIISFDVAPPEYLLSVERIASYLQLRGNAAGSGELFFDQSLRRQTPEKPEATDPEVWDLYGRLNAIYSEGI